MLLDLSKGFRREIAGIVTVEDMLDALAMLQAYGAGNESEIHSYTHVGWTGEPVGPGEPPDPLGRSTSIAVWVTVDKELLP